MIRDHFPATAVLIHLYYPDTFQYLIDKLASLQKYNPVLLVNICRDTPDKDVIIQAFKKEFPNSHFISTTNTGKDIGGKLSLIALALHLNIKYQWMLLMHDKKSPQSIHGDKWRKELYKIIDSEHIDQLKKLMSPSKAGMIGSKEFLVRYSKKNNPVELDPNYKILSSQAEKYQLKLKDFSFIGGTTFWVKKEIFDEFFKKFNPLQIRYELEKGNVMDNFGPKITHSWERLFGLIVANQGYKVYGL